MAKGKPRPGRKVHVHRGNCRCSKHTVGSHKHYRSKPDAALRELAEAIQDAKVIAAVRALVGEE